MFEAYIDESGIHQGAVVCVLAGYFANRSRWRKLEKEWIRVLKKGGMRLKDFHAKDLLKKSDPKYKKLVASLARTIADSKVHPITAAIIVDEFYSFSLDERKFMTGATWRNGKLIDSGSPDKPYYIPFQHCLRRVTKYAPAGGRAHFFFGTGSDGAFSGYAELLYRKARTDPLCEFGNKLGMIGFPEAKETPQLQAADFLAHMTYLFSLERMKHDNWGTVHADGPLRDAISATKDSSDHAFQNRDALVRTLTDGPKGLAEKIKSGRLPTNRSRGN